MKTPKMFSLAGKTALVTGGSRGLGLEMARGLGEAGATVIITARSSEELDRAHDDLASEGISVETIPWDLSRIDTIGEYLDHVFTKVNDIDILVNNAAISIVGAAEETTEEAWSQVMRVNLDAVFFLAKQVARRCFIPRSTGKIINISSIGGLGGTAIDSPYIASYSASKGAVISLTRALATEWGKYGINVNAISPGNFPSAMTEHTLDAEHHERVMSKTPLQRVGGSDDMKGVAVFFASEASRHVTGQVIVVDGGAFTTNYPASRSSMDTWRAAQ